MWVNQIQTSESRIALAELILYVRSTYEDSLGALDFLDGLLGGDPDLEDGEVGLGLVAATLETTHLHFGTVFLLSVQSVSRSPLRMFVLCSLLFLSQISVCFTSIDLDIPETFARKHKIIIIAAAQATTLKSSLSLLHFSFDHTQITNSSKYERRRTFLFSSVRPSVRLLPLLLCPTFLLLLLLLL